MSYFHCSVFPGVNIVNGGKDYSLTSLGIFGAYDKNIRIIQAVQERLGLPEEKVVTNIKYYGNTSAASIPIALAEGVEKGNVKLDSKALLCGFGAGMTWGGAIVRLREGIC